MNKLIRQYYDLLIDYAAKIGCGGMKSTVIHTEWYSPDRILIKASWEVK